MSNNFSVEAVLAGLDDRATADPICAASARVIRAQQVELAWLDNEIVEAEWRAMAYAVEIERMNKHRAAIAIVSTRTSRHAA